MPKYAIMRHTKLKAGGNLGASLEHCFRERPTDNADPKRTPDNEFLIAESKAQAMENIQKLLPEKVRKNAVVAVEYMMTASPEFWKSADEQKQKEFFDKSMEYLKEKYGEKNIASATIHRDETSPHLSAFVVPITPDGRLCARDYLGGRQLLREAQTKYAEKVQHLGLERGIEGSKAKHQTIKEYYQEIQSQNETPEQLRIRADDVTPKVEKTGLMKTEKETPEQVANRINRKIDPVIRDLNDKAKIRRFESRRAKETAETLKNKRNELQATRNALKMYHDGLKKDLKPEQWEKLKAEAEQTRQQNYREEMEAFLKASKPEQRKYLNSMSKEKRKEFNSRYEKAQKHLNQKSTTNEPDR
jgi:hypothetical protein